MAKIPYIVTIVFVILTAIFAILNNYWTGFTFFVLACLMLLSLFWGAWQIYKYFTDFQKELEERFKFYRAEKINAGGVTAEVFDQNLPTYKKSFKKSVIKDKMIKWFIILFCFALATTFLIGIILNAK